MNVKRDDYVTPITPAALYAALKLATVGSLSRASLVLLCAHVGLETGWRSCHGWNLGNVKHTAGDGHDWVTFVTREFLGGQWRVLQQDFRCYPSLEDAVPDYLHLLRGQFGYAWSAVESGDIPEFAARLRARGYYTAPEADYREGMLRVARDVERVIEPEDPETAPDSPIAFARTQPDPGQPTPPGDLPEPGDA